MIQRAKLLSRKRCVFSQATIEMLHQGVAYKILALVSAYSPLDLGCIGAWLDHELSDVLNI